MIPLPRDFINNVPFEFPLSVARLLLHISQSNHENLWRNAYQKYVLESSKFIDSQPSVNHRSSERQSIDLVPHDDIFRELIHRIYGCQIIHASTKRKNQKLEEGNSFNSENFLNMKQSYESPLNLYPILGVIETETYFICVHRPFIENTLFDCITYSPAVLAESYNKPLFVIYQLLYLLKIFHNRGIVLGNITMSDIYIRENLWIQVIPKLDANILHIETNLLQSNRNYMDNRLLTEPRSNYSLKNYCEMWCYGQISNFDYLTILNNLCGRRIGTPVHHHIMPWVTDFVARNGMNWRDLTKSKYRLNKGDAQLNLMFAPLIGNVVPHHVSDVLSEITYYVYMARRTPKIVLCKHVRPVWVPAEYPASIQRLQEWTPDECIPEFFTDPSIFKSIHEDLSDLEIPTWSTCPEDFITKHREALESQCVSEKLHHWIDLNFGFKLMGSAAVEAKNVCLSLVDEHKTLSDHGIAQLFAFPHPPRRYPTPWNSPTPPKTIQQKIEDTRRRLTRSTEDLTNPIMGHAILQNNTQSSNIGWSSYYNSKAENNFDNLVNSESAETGIERSLSYHNNVQLPVFNQIILPKDYDPIAALNGIETMELFLSKSFYLHNRTNKTMYKRDRQDFNDTDSGNAFINRLFENHELSVVERLCTAEYKSIENSTIHKPLKLLNWKHHELNIIGCIIVELFLAREIQLHCTTYMDSPYEDRIALCLRALQQNFIRLAKCVRQTACVLLDNESFNINSSTSNLVNEFGLPTLTAQQLLQPFCSTTNIPFPFNYSRIYLVVKSITDFDIAIAQLDLQAFNEWDRTQCARCNDRVKERLKVDSKIAERKVKTCVAQMNNLCEASGFEQFSSIELLVPNVINLLSNEHSSIYTAWYLFHTIAIALGCQQTRKLLLTPMLRLYDASSIDDRINFQNGNFGLSKKGRTNVSKYMDRKIINLYHHTFLLRLIVRFGIEVFLHNFVSPLIEVVGGHKQIEEDKQTYRHSPYVDMSENSSISRTHNQHDWLSTSSTSQLGSTKSLNDDIFHFENDFYASDEKILSPLKLQINETVIQEATEDGEIEAGNNHSILTREIDLISIRDVSSQQSPKIPIPSFRSGRLSTINCNIGSKKSVGSVNVTAEEIDLDHTFEQNACPEKHCKCDSLFSKKQMQQQNRHSQICTESLIWLSHRLGPVLTARHLSRNLLRKITHCYVGQENLLPDFEPDKEFIIDTSNLKFFSITHGRIVGDKNSSKALDCLQSFSALYGDQFILLQYFPHIIEIVELCKRRITASLEGGLISSLQLLKCLIPCLHDSTLMNQLHDIILTCIIHPIIRLLASCRYLMPSGFLGRNVLARKLLDVIYVLAVRIGPEMTKEHLCVPALQRYFLIFDKAHGISEHFRNATHDSCDDQPYSFDNSTFIEICRDGGLREWDIKDSTIKISQHHSDSSFASLTPPLQNIELAENLKHTMSLLDNALEEIRDVFTPHMAQLSYLPFLKYLGENVMSQIVKNHSWILNLCHESHVPLSNDRPTVSKHAENYYKFCKQFVNRDGIDSSLELLKDDIGISSSFGTRVVGNRIEVQQYIEHHEIGPVELLDLVAYKFDQTNTSRHLRGNWLSYWEHEIGRDENNSLFKLKQIKLQTFAGHTNAVKSLVCLENENSFMSASKDKTVKLWSLRSEGDGNTISSCQYTYSNHRKSVHSLSFSKSLRLTISCDSGVHLWDPFVGALVTQLDSIKLAPVCVVKAYPTPSPIILAGTAESTLKMIDGRTMSYVNEWRISPAISGSVRCIAVSPSGNWVASGLCTGYVILFDGRTGVITAHWKATDGDLLQVLAPNELQIIVSSLDHSITVWSSMDGKLLFQLKNPMEPAHCLINNHEEIIFGTPTNRIGVYSSINPDISFSGTKLRSDTFKGVLTSLAILPLNNLLLVGGDNGLINLIC